MRTPQPIQKTSTANRRKGTVRTSSASTEFRARLQSELAGRINRNPKYSLRSFATFLDLSPSFLSKLLTGKRPFTATTLDHIGAKLALSKTELALYKSRSERADSDPMSPPDVAFQQLELDQFSFIADWYHFAILEVVALPDFDSSAKQISKLLGISVHESTDAIERLVRLGFLERDSRGRLSNKSGNNTTIGPNISTPATHKQQKQILEKAILALDTIPIEDRSQTSVTLAIPRAKLDNARKAIAVFRRTMTSLLQDPNDDPDSVYQLSVSFYPLTSASLERRSK